MRSMVIRFSSSFSRLSFNTSFASSSVMGLLVKEEKATTRMREPSISRILDFIPLAMKKITSSGMERLSISVFFFRMAILVSKSGGLISTVRPHSNLDFNLSSKAGISFESRSQDITICL